MLAGMGWCPSQARLVSDPGLTTLLLTRCPRTCRRITTGAVSFGLSEASTDARRCHEHRSRCPSFSGHPSEPVFSGGCPRSRRRTQWRSRKQANRSQGCCGGAPQRVLSPVMASLAPRQLILPEVPRAGTDNPPPPLDERDAAGGIRKADNEGLEGSGHQESEGEERSDEAQRLQRRGMPLVRVPEDALWS